MSNFWSEKALEPKRKFRWLLYFAGAPQFIAKSVTKPSFQVGSSSHNFLQHQFNFPGRVTWQDVNVTLVDPVSPDSTHSLYEILKSAGYVLPSDIISDGDAGLKTISKESMVNSLGNRVRIDQIGPLGAGEIIESWNLENPLITSVNFDSLDYGVDEMLNIQITLKYDWATLNDPNGAAGTINPTGWNGVDDPGIL
jgi:hypothetical protein